MNNLLSTQFPQYFKETVLFHEKVQLTATMLPKLSGIGTTELIKGIEVNKYYMNFE